MSEIQKALTAAAPAANPLESAGGASMTPLAFGLTANPLQLAENEKAPENGDALTATTLTHGDYTATQSATDAGSGC